MTKIPLEKQSNQIDYTSKLLLLGSCFSENIGNKLTYYKFQTKQNPFGILFHAKAIENAITFAVNKEKYEEKDIFFHNERWHSFDAHSSLSTTNKNDLLRSLNSASSIISQKLVDASHIILTFGTSWIYREITLDKIVVNCHKIPQTRFVKELLSVDELTRSLKTIIKTIRCNNPKASIILTVSPVRHIKDGFIENKRSKSHLLCAIHCVLNNNGIYYFPSYEIMMDELRDYRFYKEDMIHPNQIAIEYIWQKFCCAWLSDDAQKIMMRVEKIQKGLSHKPFNAQSRQHQLFLEKLQIKKMQLQKEYPFMKF